MPKGAKLSTPAPPELAVCDFCPSRHKPLRWNSRTCGACQKAGKPDQSLLSWDAYMAALPKRRIRKARNAH